MGSSDKHCLKANSGIAPRRLSSPHRRALSWRRSVGAAGLLPRARHLRAGSQSFDGEHIVGVSSICRLRARKPSCIERPPPPTFCVDARMARWRSGDAADCKSVHPGSIPGRASTIFQALSYLTGG